MGMFKDIRQLQKQAKEIDKTWDPGAQMQEAKARMAAASQSMAVQTQTAQLLTTGVRGRGTITAVRETGMYLNMEAVLHIDVLLMADGRPPVPASCEGPVSPAFLGRVTPGASVEVAFDPADPSIVAIDWTKP